MFNLIVAIDNKNGISKNNEIPWFIKEDLQFFKKTTLNSYVVMGKNTWLSLKKPLKDRINIVISSTLQKSQLNTPDHIFKDFQSCLFFLRKEITPLTYTSDYSPLYTQNVKKTNIFIIGGSRLYNEAISYKECKNIYITEIYKNYNCDNFFPKLDKYYQLLNISNFNYDSDSDTYFRFLHYQRYNLYTKFWFNTEETNYINLLKNILSNGYVKNDRTGVGTLSLFGKTLHYDISDTFPILTTRKQFFRGIFEELMFYLRGQTNNQILVDKGINVWTQNTTTDFLQKNNLNLNSGDMGATYGFNFRHFGAEYFDCNFDYKNNGFDQLENIIYLIKNDPNSRRMIISLWDPNNNQKAALPSCLCWYQFYVRQNYLDLLIHIRSSDYFLANNWNTCTGALFVYLICNLQDIDLKPGRIIVNTGDVHIYNNHMEAIHESLQRIPKPFPKLHIKSKKQKITDFEFTDVSLIGYNAEPSIKVDMAI